MRLCPLPPCSKHSTPALSDPGWVCGSLGFGERGPKGITVCLGEGLGGMEGL